MRGDKGDEVEGMRGDEIEGMRGDVGEKLKGCDSQFVNVMVVFCFLQSVLMPLVMKCPLSTFGLYRLIIRSHLLSQIGLRP